jgi:hypothetical protein
MVVIAPKGSHSQRLSRLVACVQRDREIYGFSRLGLSALASSLDRVSKQPHHD